MLEHPTKVDRMIFAQSLRAEMVGRMSELDQGTKPLAR
jgi:hypothetical protein